MSQREECPKCNKNCTTKLERSSRYEKYQCYCGHEWRVEFEEETKPSRLPGVAKPGPGSGKK